MDNISRFTKEEGLILTDQTPEQKQMLKKVPEDWVAWEVDWKNRKLIPLIKRHLTTGKNYVINVTR